MEPIILSEKPLIRAYLGDCMELMEDKPVGHWDLAICDPPYQVKMSGGKSPKNGFKGVKAWDKMRLGWDMQRPDTKYFNTLFDVSINQIIWGANYFTKHLPASMGWVFWYKMQDNFSFSDGELAYTSFHSKARIFKYARGMESGFAPGGCGSPNIHPTQKPVSLYLWLLTTYAKPGQRILDSHGGSFSSAIACWKTGYDLDICEIDEEYFNEACERFERETRQLKLFA